MEADLHYMGYAITHYFKHAFIWIAKWVNPENLTGVYSAFTYWDKLPRTE